VEVQYWTRELGVSKVRLAELVKQHGNSVEKKRQYVRDYPATILAADFKGVRGGAITG
jgi:hypothetical protein